MFVILAWLLFTCLSGKAVPESEKRRVRLIHWIAKSVDVSFFSDSPTRQIGLRHTQNETDGLKKQVTIREYSRNETT
jgi:hypothetical protein